MSLIFLILFSYFTFFSHQKLFGTCKHAGYTCNLRKLYNKLGFFIRDRDPGEKKTRLKACAKNFVPCEEKKHSFFELELPMHTPTANPSFNTVFVAFYTSEIVKCSRELLKQEQSTIFFFHLRLFLARTYKWSFFMLFYE